MSGEGQFRPADESWVVAVHRSKDDDTPLGAGVVIDDHRVLTCAHVVGVRDDGLWRPNPAQVWVVFPKADGDGQFKPVQVQRPPVFPEGASGGRDVAVLHLAEPVPAGVIPARLKCPKPEDLVSAQWWAFGFPETKGSSASGRIGDTIGFDWVRLDATESKYQIERGFSGGGVWSSKYRAVVGLVGTSKGGDGQAITLYQADRLLPDENIRLLAERWSAADQADDDVAMTAWGWSLSDDEEGPVHWLPRGRGVGIDSEQGYRFCGRSAALAEIRDWLDRPEPDRQVLVVTGSPGAGKSAVLGRIVTTADPGAVAQLPASDNGGRASIGSVACAVHAKGKTVLEVAAEIARAASAAIPGRMEDFTTALKDVFRDPEQPRSRGRFNVIIDALDEAASPRDARAIIRDIALPLAGTFADDGVQVVVGTRDTDGGDNLLDRFGDAKKLVDLDHPDFFASDDLAVYVLATLQLAGDERPGNPYNNDAAAGPVADRIAALSEQNFLAAGLTARSHGLYDKVAADPASLSFASTVDDALSTYLERVSKAAVAVVPGVSAERLLTALAFAEVPGFSTRLWRTALQALDAGDVPETALTEFARSAAASFLVESSGGGEGTTFRLFHQALSDALLRARARIFERADDQEALTRAFLQVGRDAGWETAPAYLLRSLPAHAALAGLTSELLADDAYLLHADLRRLLQAAGQDLGSAEHQRTRLLRLTPQALDASSANRAAMLSVTEALDGLGNAYRDDRWQAPYRARWAATSPRGERVTCQGHESEINAVCGVTVDKRKLLASGGTDCTVRLWDPDTGEQASTLGDHQGRVRAVCVITVDDRPLLVSAADDGANGTIRVWDPDTGEQRWSFTGQQGRIRAVCAITVDKREWLAFGSDDGTVRLWDPGTGEQVRMLDGHQREVRALCVITVDKRKLLASGGADGTVRTWDPDTGQQIEVLQGDQAGVNAVCAITVDDREWLASGSDDGTVRLWDPVPGGQVRTLSGHQGWVRAVCAVTVGDRELLVSGSDDQTVRVWGTSSTELADPASDRQGGVSALCTVTGRGRELLASGSDDGTVRLRSPDTGQQIALLNGHEGRVRAVCAITIDKRELLASGGDDGVVRVWDPDTEEQVSALNDHEVRVNAVCAITVDNRELLASGSDDGTLRLWDPESQGQVTVLRGGQRWVSAVCAVMTADGQRLLASGGDDGDYGAVRLWDPATGNQVRVLKGGQGWVRAVCTVNADGRELLASIGLDGAVRLWDPGTGEQVKVLEGHPAGIFTVCTVMVGSRELLVSGGDDRTVRLWDPESGACLAVVPTHRLTCGVTAAGDSLAIGLDSGLLVIQPSATALE